MSERPTHTITPTLYNAWRYYTASEYGDAESFIATLERRKIPTTEAMRRGIAFENAVFAVTQGLPHGQDVNPRHEACIQEVADLVRGGVWQVKAERTITIAGRAYALRGVADVLLRDTVYDIKTTMAYDVGRYRNTLQHLAYMYIFGFPKAAYIASDLSAVYVEDYTWADGAGEVELRARLTAMMGHILSAPALAERYEKHWAAKA